jgi:hypothetical protein
VALAAIAVVQIGYYVTVRPRLTIGNLAITSDLALSEAELQRVAGIAVGDRFSAIDLDAVRLRLLDFPEVAAATVARAFPDALLLDVRARVPLLALVARTPAGASVPFTIDREGYLYRAGLPELERDLIVVSGLQATADDVGAPVGSGVLPLVLDLAYLHDHHAELSSLISQVHIVPPDGGALRSVTGAAAADTVVYTVGYSTPLYFGKHIDADSLTTGLLILDTLARAGQLGAARYVDMRFGPPVLMGSTE